jgi:membrane complex biogenesis BtpA family protein
MAKAKIYGMVHLNALPGTPKNSENIVEICDKAMEEASLYREHGLDGIIIENMHDLPYLNRNVGPEITASMAVICSKLRSEYPDWEIGVQVLAGANEEALSIANACSLDFIRAEGFVYSHVADEGIMNSDAAELLRFRKKIGASAIKVYCDIKKKHASHSLTADIPIEDIAKAAMFFLADGLIVTGNSTGEEASLEELQKLNSLELGLPIIIGSGINKDNLANYVYLADYLIVGSSFKKEAYWANDIDRNRLAAFMEAFREL